MMSPAGIILLALFMGCVIVIAMFLRLMWEDGEAVEICIDDIEEFDALVPVQEQREPGGNISMHS